MLVPPGLLLLREGACVVCALPYCPTCLLPVWLPPTSCEARCADSCVCVSPCCRAACRCVLSWLGSLPRTSTAS
jgi:hypothetical protein